MRKTQTTEELDSLLGRGGLGAARRDAILDSVLVRVKGERLTRSRWRWSFAGLGVAATAAALLLVAHLPSVPGEAAFRVKGVGTRPATTTPSTELECLGATLAACPTGSLLIVRATGVRGFVSAWAEPVGGGERIWYFSSETTSPRVDAAASVGLAARAVKIGPEHVPGTYQVEVRVTERPMAREELLRPYDKAQLAGGHFSLTVTSP